jgi:cytochrome c biogenesis protein CcdA
MKPCCLPLVSIIFSGSAGGLVGGFFLGIVLIVIGVMLLFNMDKLMIRLLSPYFPTTFYGL